MYGELGSRDGVTNLEGLYLRYNVWVNPLSR